MDTLDITIIVPTKNEVKNLPRFLASIPPELPLIMVDASSDETRDLAMGLRSGNTTVHYSPAPITEARNYGSVIAQTKWLLFTDADVEFAPDYFQRLADVQAQGAVYGTKIGTGGYEAYYRSFCGWQSRLDRLGIPAVSGSNLLLEKHIWRAVGGFDTRLLVNEDTEIGYRIKRSGYPIHFIPDLRVIAFDHRRLKKGTLRKNLHSLTRCALIYLNIFPALWRDKDWGYWSESGGR